MVPTSSPGLTDVTLTLTGLGHTYPGDLSMLLVGPQGQSVILMSRIGGGTDAVNATITFDDDGPAMSTPIVSGTFRPTNLGAGVFPGPAPAGPYGTSMSVFDATDPSGTWSLYIQDIWLYDSGSISGGWSLTLEAPTATGDYTPASGSVSFSPGTTTRTVTVEVTGDTAVESDETFTLGLSGATNATIADAEGVGTITNDDGGSSPPSRQLTVTVAGSGRVTSAPGRDRLRPRLYRELHVGDRGHIDGDRRSRRHVRRLVR